MLETRLGCRPGGLPAWQGFAGAADEEAILTKVRLKYAIPEIGGTLYQVELNCFRQEEATVTMYRHPSVQ